MDINTSEQWLLNGNCKLCRRKNYCSKECKKAKTRRLALVQSLVHQKMDEYTGGAYSEIMSHLKKKE